MRPATVGVAFSAASPYTRGTMPTAWYTLAAVGIADWN